MALGKNNRRNGGRNRRKSVGLWGCPGLCRDIKQKAPSLFQYFLPKLLYLLTRCFSELFPPSSCDSGFTSSLSCVFRFIDFRFSICTSKIHHPTPQIQIFTAVVLHLFYTGFAQDYAHFGELRVRVRGQAGCGWSNFRNFAPYDTRTDQEYEGPRSRPKEVSLTSITDNIRSTKRSNYR